MVFTLIKRVDMYGTNIGFTFKGKSNYQTIYGGVCTVMTFLALLFIYVMKTIDFIGKIDPDLTMVDSLSDTMDTFDLYDLNYRFAIRNIEPKYGLISVT